MLDDLCRRSKPEGRAQLDPALASETTPCRVFRPEIARQRFAALAAMRQRLARVPLRLLLAFSIKTNPRTELLHLAREHEFLAEAISSDELAWSLQTGFRHDEIVGNGPVPFPTGGPALAFAFADSLEAFDRNASARVARVVGVRLRPSMIRSRFGIPVEDDASLCERLRAYDLERGLGVSFHARREDFGAARWRDVACDVVQRAVTLSRASGRDIVTFDIGGGWTPEQLDAEFGADVAWLVERLRKALPACVHLIAEPGQGICTPTEALLTTIIEVRKRAGKREAIVDAGYPEWPLMHAYPHPIFLLRDTWTPIGHGPDRLGGRTCLEYDVVEGLRLPDDVRAGDRLLIADTGSYDHSMALEFGRGRVPSPASEIGDVPHVED